MLKDIYIESDRAKLGSSQTVDKMAGIKQKAAVILDQFRQMSQGVAEFVQMSTQMHQDATRQKAAGAEMNASINAASGLVGEISAQIGEVSFAVSEQAKAAQKIAVSMEELSVLVGDLEQFLGKFRIQ